MAGSSASSNPSCTPSGPLVLGVFAFASPRIPKLQTDQKECEDTLRVTPAPVPVNGTATSEMGLCFEKHSISFTIMMAHWRHSITRSGLPNPDSIHCGPFELLNVVRFEQKMRSVIPVTTAGATHFITQTSARFSFIDRLMWWRRKSKH